MVASVRLLLQINPMKIIIAERCIALGTLALSRVISGFQALKAEHMETLCQDGVFLASVTAGASQSGLKSNMK